MKRARAHTCDQDRIAQQPVVAARRSPPSSTTAGIVALPAIHSRMIRPQQCGSHQPGSHQGARLLESAFSKQLWSPPRPQQSSHSPAVEHDA